MGILNRAKRIIRSHLNAAADEIKSRTVGADEPDPLSDEAATMDAEAWYQAAKARQAGANQRRAEGGAQGARPQVGRPLDIQQAYLRLECPVGSDLKTVRTSWRKLMRKYHPDRFPGDEKKREAATKVAAAINEAYQKLEDHLKALGDKG